MGYQQTIARPLLMNDIQFNEIDVWKIALCSERIHLDKPILKKPKKENNPAFVTTLVFVSSKSMLQKR